MERLVQSERRGVRRLVLKAGRGNALDRALLDQLAQRFAAAEADGAPSLVLAAEGRSFCTGLNLVRAYDLDRAEMSQLMHSLHLALRAVFTYSGPVVAAIQGHALAGGALLAMACDRRVMVDGHHLFGIHGVHLGVSYPQIAVEILRAQLPRPLLEELLYAGHLYSSEEALGVGLIDEVVTPIAFARRGEELAKELMNGSPLAFRVDKARLRMAARDRLAVYDEAGAEQWLAVWFSEATRGRVGEAGRALAQGEGPRPGERMSPAAEQSKRLGEPE